MKSKIFTLFATLTLSAGALFASDTDVDGIYYNFDATNLTATVTYCGNSSSDYDEYTGDVVIPATVTYGGKTYSVTSIGDGAFRFCSGLTSVTIPNSVTSIEGGAFWDCSGLTSVVWNAKNCADVSSSYYAPFDNASQITSFTFGSEVEHIPAYLCYGMENLTSVTISNSVTSIGGSAFSGCSGLTSIVVESGNTTYDSRNGCNAIIETATNTLVVGCQATIIPNSVTSIGDWAFEDCSGLTSVTIPNSVTSIGRSAFDGCSGLTSVTIPNNVMSIGDYAFRGCSGLTSVVWNAKNCAYAPFDNASQITSFTFGSEVEHIPAYLCYGMENLTSVTIPNNVMSIGDYAFRFCSGLTSVTIPNSVTSIGGAAFGGCSRLTSVVWNAKNCADLEYYDNVMGTYYYGPFFDNASQITSFTFGSEVEHIPAYLCYGMENLTSVTIPNSVTSIGKEAFKYCSGLTSITIPNSVTSIGDWAFEDCSGLTKTNYTGDIAGWCGINFGRWGSSPTTYSHNLYINDVEVKDLVIPNSVTSIGNYAFSGCSGLTSVTIPNSVTSIGNYAFDECSSLTSITIPNSVTSIEGGAFWGCSGLTSVTIGNSVTSIGEEAFSGCTKLINIVCYAAEPPSCDASVFANYNVFLKVPCNNLTAYQTHVCWGSFKYISCIGSEEVQVTEFGVTPSTNEAQFTWPAEPNAATYELVISKDGVVFCTLTFNASGQLMGIAFAPGANTAATTATSGFQFTVTGLDEASHYTYTFDAKDADGGVIQHYAGEFNTDGSVGLGQIELAGLYTQAGRIVCEGEFRIYDLLGRDVTRLNGSLNGVYVVKTANAAVKVVVR